MYCILLYTHVNEMRQENNNVTTDDIFLCVFIYSFYSSVCVCVFVTYAVTFYPEKIIC